jgi:hypothetical protein
MNPLTVLADFQQMTSTQLNNYLAAFLNINRVPTSLIGIKSQATTNPVIARTILP